MKREYYLVTGLYFVISIAVLWHLLLPGYIPLQVSTHAQYIPEFWYELLNVYNLLRGVLNVLFNEWIAQKVLIVGILLCAGLSMYSCVPSKEKKAKFLGGLFYMINPFLHTRILVGHLHVAAGYALLPLAFLALRNLKFEKKTSWIVLIFFSYFLTNVSPHMGYIFASFASLMAIILIFKKQIKQALVMLGCTIVGAALNFQEFFKDNYKIIGDFSAEQYEIFSTSIDHQLGALGNVLGLYGYHIESSIMQDGFLFTKQLISFWPLMVLLFWIVAFAGFIRFWKKNRSFSLASLLTLIVATTLAVGVSAPWSKPIYVFLWEHGPLFRAFREPQKWVAFLCFFIAFYGAIAVGTTLYRARKEGRKKFIWSVIGTSFITIIIYNITFFGGFFGQAKTFQFPDSWYQARNFLIESSPCYQSEKCDEQPKAIFLPWHMYLNFDFSHYFYISNPGRSFFYPVEVIGGDNLEHRDVFSISANPRSKLIESLLIHPTADKLKQLREEYSIKWIILYETPPEQETFNYQTLKEQRSISRVFGQEKLEIYEINGGPLE